MNEQEFMNKFGEFSHLFDIVEINEVKIIHTNETGKWLWAVQISGTEEWLEAFETEKEATEYCEINGYIIEI